MRETKSLLITLKYRQCHANCRFYKLFISTTCRILPDSPYKLDYVYDKEILGVVWAFTKKFDKTISLAFSKWLNKQNIDFLSEESERKLIKGDTDKKIRRRHLNILNSVYYGKARKWHCK